MPRQRRQSAHPNLLRGRYNSAELEALQKARYLAAFSVDGMLTTGMKAAGVGNHVVYQWREMDDAFVMRENELRAELADRLESEAIRRAHDGWDRPIYQRGVLCGYERVYSDSLLKLMLAAVRPEKFRENINVSGQVEQIVRQVSGFNAAEVL
jgi:hypothetical protein